MSSDEESFHQNREKFIVERSSEPQPDEVNPDFFGPALPPHLLRKQIFENDGEKKEIYGPVLPYDHLYEKDKRRGQEMRTCDAEETKQKAMIGPEIPEHLKKSHSKTVEEESEPSDDEGFGPSTNLMATEVAVNYYEFTRGQSSTKKDESGPSVQREEWMTQLPAKKRASAGLMARQFKSRMQSDKESDSSVWTETPGNKDKKDKKKDHKIILEMNRLKERDEEMEKLARRAEEKLRKKKTLLEIHFKNKKKKKKKEAKEKKDTPPERRPFDRNIDLQVHRFDESKRRAILNKNQFLSDRFASGQSKFL